MSMRRGSSGLGSDGLPISGGGTGAQRFAQRQQEMPETAEQKAAKAKAAAERTAAEQAVAEQIAAEQAAAEQVTQKAAEAKAAADRAAAEQAAAEQAQRATAERAAALRSTAFGSGGLLRSTMRVLSLSQEPAYVKLVDEEGDDGLPGAKGSRLLNFCAGKGLVSLSELEDVLRTAPTSATDRVVPMSEAETDASTLMVEGDSAISILIRRCALDEDEYPMNKEELPAMIQALVSADKTAVTQ